jgi:ribosomal protein S18 acetylase RimI-like enzyme
VSIAIRIVAEHEWERYRMIRLRALADAPTAFGSTLEGERSLPESLWRDRLRGPDGVVFVAHDGDEWAGIVGAFVSDDAPTTAHLVSMWVDPAFRRRGAGALLVDAVVAWTLDRGLDRVDLWVTETNVRAIRLYAGCGFVLGVERQPLPSNPELSEVAMHRDLRRGLPLPSSKLVVESDEPAEIAALEIGRRYRVDWKHQRLRRTFRFVGTLVSVEEPTEDELGRVLTFEVKPRFGRPALQHVNTTTLTAIERVPYPD